MLFFYGGSKIFVYVPVLEEVVEAPGGGDAGGSVDDQDPAVVVEQDTVQPFLHPLQSYSYLEHVK